MSPSAAVHPAAASTTMTTMSAASAAAWERATPIASTCKQARTGGTLPSDQIRSDDHSRQLCRADRLHLQAMHSRQRGGAQGEGSAGF
jgi:hypothetical protein